MTRALQEPSGMPGNVEKDRRPEPPGFLSAYPGYRSTALLDRLRVTDYSYLDAAGHVYLDYTGAGLPARAQLTAHAERIRGRCFGNPHSQSPASAASTDLIERTRLAVLAHFNAPVTAALSKGRNCLILTNWTAHLDKLADALRALGHDPVILRGGMGAKARIAALARLEPKPGGTPLLAVATGPYAGEGFDCPALDTLFLAAPVAQKGRLVQYAGRILRPYDGKATAEVHDYHDELTGVLASALAKRAPGYTSLGFPDPRKVLYTPSANALTMT